MMTIEEITQTRKAIGISQRDMAKKAGISVSTLQRYEQGLPIRLACERRIREALRREMDIAAETMV